MIRLIVLGKCIARAVKPVPRNSLEASLVSGWAPDWKAFVANEFREIEWLVRITKKFHGENWSWSLQAKASAFQRFQRQSVSISNLKRLAIFKHLQKSYAPFGRLERQIQAASFSNFTQVCVVFGRSWQPATTFAENENLNAARQTAWRLYSGAREKPFW